ncbi:hypothetical protein KJ969_00895 [Patescibacteria group bacterium]|nr:hypothetical protein [Patescibacteria group bacterium]MBU1922097.1 hypothetical protein [Patescibacteria group bacterium]
MNNEHLQAELEKLEKAMPIKGGRHLVLFGTGIVVGICGMLIRAVYLGIMNDPVVSDQWVGKFGATALVSCLFFMLDLAIAPAAPPVTDQYTRGVTRLCQWLKAYWQRNLVGNSAWLCLYDHDELKISIEDNRNPLMVPPKDMVKGLKLAMLVPLSPWLNTPKHMFLYNSLKGSFPVQGCKVRISIIFPATKTLVLSFRDYEGSKICIGAKHLLDIVKNECYFMAGFPLNGIMGIIHDLHISEISLRSELKRVKSICTEKEDKLFDALDTLFKESQALKDTSRVGKSEPGRLIRERMENALLDLLPPNHAYRKILEKA